MRPPFTDAMVGSALRSPVAAVGFAVFMSSLDLGHALGLTDLTELPLRTKGRYIVGVSGKRIKLACTNWYGAHSGTFVPGGLETRPFRDIVATIVDLGFNCVRLPYSTQAQVENPVVERAHVAANPEFYGKRFYFVLDELVAAMTAVGLMVIPNNQNHEAGWCCHYTQNEGLWYVPGYPESAWVEGLTNITKRYRRNPMVVGMDLRNEVHDYGATKLTWGDGSATTDWAAAATRAGNAVLAENPDALIFVNGLCFGMEIRPARQHPIRLAQENRVIYEAHNYLEFNIFELFSQVVLSWSNVRLICGLLFFACLLALWGFLSAWRSLGKPRPSRRSLLGTIGLWIFVLSGIAYALSAASVAQLRLLPACDWWARKDVVPVAIAFGVLAALGLCLVAAAASAPSIASLAARLRRAHCRRDGAPSEPKPAMASGTNGDCPSITVIDISTEAERSQDGGDQEGSDGDVSTGLFGAAGYGSYRTVGRRCRCCRCSRGVSGAGGGRREEGEGEELERAVWDRGLCCGLQACCCCGFVLISAGLFFAFAVIAPTYAMLAWHLDNSWGFLLEDGHDYTAPVWMGEFGGPVSGNYWVNVVRYLSERDVDFAHWALNGKKWTTGFIDTTDGGKWVDQAPHWSDEPFGVLQADYKTIRHPWMMLDLNALQSSPAQYRPPPPPCDRRVLGSSCGG
mmetsp:Transcript_122005/g.390081  ORF Transcript_122005/g.390081 Transcript_122005/m.390081 type:complete len:683 (-) Transcript_122005:146-2194(-)